jgi:prepilin-type N-terminal cleavage/methylation domain-containing protein
MTNKRQHPSIRLPGFTIVECLISLAISAILLTALAVAFNAAVMNYRENEQMYQTINNARQALTRMTSQLRTASPDPTLEPHWAVDPLEPDNRCTFHTPANESITYEFRSADGKLYLKTNADGHEYVLCNNVTAATFTKTPTTSPPLGDCKSVQISLTVRTGDYERTLAAAAVIRKNLSL